MKEFTIDTLVEAACCIAAGNKMPSGEPMFDLDKRFGGWVKEYVKERLILQGSHKKPDMEVR